jgi:hypothetical protein
LADRLRDLVEVAMNDRESLIEASGIGVGSAADALERAEHDLVDTLGRAQARLNVPQAKGSAAGVLRAAAIAAQQRADVVEVAEEVEKARMRAERRRRGLEPPDGLNLETGGQ